MEISSDISRKSLEIFAIRTYSFSQSILCLSPRTLEQNYLTTYAHARIYVFLSINLKPTFLRTFTLVIRKMYLILYVFYLNLNFFFRFVKRLDLLLDRRYINVLLLLIIIIFREMIGNARTTVG